MVSLYKGLKYCGIAMIIFGSVWAFVLSTAFIFWYLIDTPLEVLSLLWGLAGITFVFSTPVYILGISRIGAAAKDLGKSARRYALVAIPLGVAGVVSLFLSIGYLLQFFEQEGGWLGLSLAGSPGWLLVAAANFFSVGRLRDREHLDRAKKIFFFEINGFLLVGIILSVVTYTMSTVGGDLTPSFLLLYLAPPIPLLIIGAVQFLSTAKLYKLPERSPYVEVVTPVSREAPPTDEQRLLPFVQYDFTDVLTPEMFAKGFCFNCQAFVSSELETCPKCNNDIETEEIVKII